MAKVKITSKDLLKTIMVDMIQLNVDILKFHMNMSKDEKEIRGYKKIIRMSNTSIDIIKGVDHEDILALLYNNFLAGRESLFAILVSTINKYVKTWDKSEKGYQEFKDFEKENSERMFEARKRKQEMSQKIKEAKEQGKKLDFVYDKGKIVPVINEEKTN